MKAELPLPTADAPRTTDARRTTATQRRFGRREGARDVKKQGRFLTRPRWTGLTAGPEDPPCDRDDARTVRSANWRPRVVAGALAAISLTCLSGCAMALLNGASGGGGSTASSSPAPATRPASQIAADDAITAAVRSRLSTNPALKPFNLAVDTHDGVVTLRGQVAKVEQRTAAQIDARAVKGVKSVANLLTVR